MCLNVQHMQHMWKKLENSLQLCVNILNVYSISRLLYISRLQMQVRTWLSNALKKEEESWQLTNKLEQIDGCYFSNLALDVIPVRAILG